MIGISKLYCGAVEAADVLRYGRESGKLPSHLLQFSADKKPVVVWNMTRRCNLKCIHCYSNSQNIYYADELTTGEGKRLIADLAAFGCPVVLFSGGEPLIREDLHELVQFAVDQGMRAVISTNGTLITKEKAEVFRKIGLSYVGVSLDGVKEIHDRFRGVKGAFETTMKGIRICRDAGIKVGVRFTMTKGNFSDIPAIFDLLEEEDIPRACFYHLVYAGRGSKLIEEDLSHEEKRIVLDLIMDRTRDLFTKGTPREVLTVDNHADGPYLYLRLLREDPQRAAEVMELLLMNGGNSSGHGIGCVSWDGEVHADQFWRGLSFGNVRQRPFSEIWMDTSNELMARLKDKKHHLKGRCATCCWFAICGGNFRARAEAATGDIWAPDPACYLTDEEIDRKVERDYRTVVLVTGGTRSGKSSFALELAEKLEGKRLFLATAEALDEEMGQRIHRHRKQRGNRWDTLEEPIYLGKALRPALGLYKTIVVDCLTLWMSNLLGKYPDRDENAAEIIDDFFSCLSEFDGTLIVISNEVGMGIVPDNKLARIYRDQLGLLNQRMAERADKVYVLFSGIPVEVKGRKSPLSPL